MIRRLVIVGGLAAALAGGFGTTAFASSSPAAQTVSGCYFTNFNTGTCPSASISIGSSGTLSARELIQVPVTVSCTPSAPGLNASAYVQLTVQQASGKSTSVATGTAFIPSCAGQPVSILLSAASATSTNPISSSGPFHGGSALATVTATVTDDSFSSGYTTVGPQVVKI